MDWGDFFSAEDSVWNMGGTHASIHPGWTPLEGYRQFVRVGIGGWGLQQSLQKASQKASESRTGERGACCSCETWVIRKGFLASLLGRYPAASHHRIVIHIIVCARGVPRTCMRAVGSRQEGDLYWWGVRGALGIYLCCPYKPGVVLPRGDHRTF